MKTLLALALALNLAMCVGPTARVAYPVGDGKAFAEISGDRVSIGYSGRLPAPRGLAK
ncbi:MAG: hypothetical protein ABMA13_16900 [Chthoniobacteraceae bacterium]